jgi:hypothetical protein
MCEQHEKYPRFSYAEPRKLHKATVEIEIESLNEKDGEEMLEKFLGETEYVYSRFQKRYIPIQKRKQKCHE